VTDISAVSGWASRRRLTCKHDMSCSGAPQRDGAHAAARAAVHLRGAAWTGRGAVSPPLPGAALSPSHAAVILDPKALGCALRRLVDCAVHVLN